MSSSERLLLILHIGFAIFTLGPLTAATMASPRQIRNRNVVVLRHLILTTRIYGLGTLGVFLFGLFLAGGEFDHVWLSASMTLFVVALVLLVIVDRDQQRAAHKLELAASSSAGPGTAVATREPASSGAGDPAGTEPSAGSEGGEGGQAATGAATAGSAESAQTAEASAGTPAGPAAPSEGEQIAQVEQGRIAALAGVIATIWLVILFLMVWYG